MDTALSLTEMEYGSITPVGLPKDWPIIIDEAVMKHDTVIIGGGKRGSKLAIKTRFLNSMPNSVVINIAKSHNYIQSSF